MKFDISKVMTCLNADEVQVDTKRDARIEAVYVLTCLKDDEEVKGE
jgi:hypothetical protein